MQKKSRAERRREKLRGKDAKPFVDKIKPFLSFKHPVTRFCLVFAGLLIAFSLFIFQKSAERFIIHPFTGFIAAQAAWLLKSLGMQVTASGITITGEGFSVEILGNCNAIFEMGLYLSAVIAFPAMLKEKAVGGILGVIFIYLLNLLRVVLLFLVGVYVPQYFEESHVYVSQTLFIAVVALFWLLWAGKWVKGPVQ
jgi:exosortase/archaeosortase family protein